MKLFLFTAMAITLTLPTISNGAIPGKYRPVLRDGVYIGCIVEGKFVDGVDLPPKLCVSVYAVPSKFKNREYASLALETAMGMVAAGAPSDWVNYDDFELLSEKLNDDGVHIVGQYEVKFRSDAGFKYLVKIVDGLVIAVTVTCKTCG